MENKKTSTLLRLLLELHNRSTNSTIKRLTKSLFNVITRFQYGTTEEVDLWYGSRQDKTKK